MIASTALCALMLVTGASARSLSYEVLKSSDLVKYKGAIYQGCYLEKTQDLYVTDAVGRPPVKEAHLLVVDSKNLKLKKDVNAPHFDNKTGLLADYGVACDDSAQRVWVTNTRQDTVSYFNVEDDLKRTTFAKGAIKHPRDIFVDKKTGYAWASSAGSSVVSVFSSNKTDGPLKTVNVSQEIGANFSTVMAITADEAERLLYTISLEDHTAVAISLDDYKVKSHWDLPNSGSSSGIAFDSKRKHLFVANQDTNNTIVLDVKSGEVIKDIPIPHGGLNAAYEPVEDVVFIVSFDGNAVHVIDAADFSEITNFNVTKPVRATVAGKGVVYVTDKGADGVSKYTPKNATIGAVEGNKTHVAPKPHANSAGKAGALTGCIGAGFVGAAVALL